MKDVSVNKSKLLDILKKNRDKHASDFLKAVDGYYIDAMDKLKEAIEVAESKEGKIPGIHLPMPDDHTSDYDRAIGMLEMEVNDIVTINQEEYSNYVDDNWAWKHQWSLSNTNYMSKSSI